jgi:hypothetical protein
MMIRHGGGYNVLFATPWVAHIQHVFGHAVCFRHPNLDK